MPVVIKPLSASMREEALSFIEQYEAECVNLAQEILRGGENCFCVFYSEQAQDNDAQGESGAQGSKLAGLFALKKKRSLFHCLPFAKYKSAFDKKICNEAQKPLMEFFESNEPFCVNGEAAGGLYVKNILRHKKTPRAPSVVNKYFLMTLEEPQNKKALQDSGAKIESHAKKTGGGLFVSLAELSDYAALLPLELGYQREEVVPPSFDISDAVLEAAFKMDLAQGQTFALFEGARAVAKAKVTASGRRFCMLGGVYTIPSERKKGLASFLVGQMMAWLKAEAPCVQRQTAGGGSTDFGAPVDSANQSLPLKNFCLYAKQQNAAALALYKSLGFVLGGEYLLIYY